MESLKLPCLNNVYKDRTVFITGASGFLGKVMIEKMLHALPGIKRIYVLIRPSKGKSGADRWNELVKSELFNRVRRDCPTALDKVVAVEGDIALPELGISPADLKRVLAETSMVFHCAATIRFNLPLKEAANLNMQGVQRLIALCHRMPLLKCYLHCSTCYVGADRKGTLVEERLYEPLCDPHKLIEASEWMRDDVFECISRGACKSFGNTYCFTKALAEHIVVKDAAGLPALIFRPSMVGNVWRDGIPGWADAFQGIAAMFAACGTGAIARVPLAERDFIDFVPVDAVSSAMIAAAAHRACSSAPGIPVLHCNSSTLNPLYFTEQRPAVMEAAFKYPLDNIMATPVFSMLGSDPLERRMHLLRGRYLGPALDRIGALVGKKPYWGRAYGRIAETYTVLTKFTANYAFATRNLLVLRDCLTDEDKETFNFDVRQVDWKAYLFDVWLGMKVFLMKDNIVDRERVRAARRNVRLMQLKDALVTFVMCYMCTALLTGSTTAWHILVPLTAIMHGYCSVFTYQPCGIASIHDYKKRVEDAMGEPLKPMNS